MNKKAFTLIELLVVVLIIGILAAIALPQYEIAVEKSRLTEAFTIASSVQKSIDVWLLENGYPEGQVTLLGAYSVYLNDSLAVDFSHLCDETGCRSKNFTYSADCSSVVGKSCVIAVQRKGDDPWYQFEFAKEETGAWSGGECDYVSGDRIGEKICKGLETQGNGFYACENC